MFGGRSKKPDAFLMAQACMILVNVIDLHLQGLQLAKDVSIEDPSLDNSSDLLELMAQIDEEVEILKHARRVFAYAYGG
jgi:hypothetical protein